MWLGPRREAIRDPSLQDGLQISLCDPGTRTRITGKGARPVGCMARRLTAATWSLPPEGTPCLPLGLKWGALRASLVTQTVKRLPAMRKTHGSIFIFLGQEDALEKEMATYSSVLAWEIPWMEEPGGLQSMGSQSVRHD